MRRRAWWYVGVQSLVLLGGFAVNWTLAADKGLFVWELTRSPVLAATVAPKDADLRFRMGNYYFGGGAYDIEAAEDLYREAIALDPLLPGTHYQLARVEFIRGAFSDALLSINRELELYPRNNRSLYVRALIHGYVGNLDAAARDFETFLAWKPESWAGHNDLAWIYFQQGNYKGAESVARAGLVHAPDNPWLLNALGVALLNLGRNEEARDAFQDALAAFDLMDERDWGMAYPGNDPGVYGKGFEATKESVARNLALAQAGDR